MASTFTPPIGPSFSTTQRTSPRVNEATFGDGYSQRVPMGLNSTPSTITAKWDVVDNAQALAIIAFFENQNGTEPFNYSFPWDTRSRLWVCQDWSLTPIDGGGDELIYTINATLREVFDPVVIEGETTIALTQVGGAQVALNVSDAEEFVITYGG